MSFDFIDWQTELTEEQRSWYEKTSAVCKEHIDPNLAEAFEAFLFACGAVVSLFVLQRMWSRRAWLLHQKHT